MAYSCGYCGYSCGCSASCTCYEVPNCGCPTTTTTTTTTTINPNCEPCEEIYNSDCVVYTGPNVECYGLKTGDNLSEILENIVKNLPECKTTIAPQTCFFTGTVTQIL